VITKSANLIITYKFNWKLIMSKEYSTALKLGATASFISIMALSVSERIAFANAVSPSLLPALKNALLKEA
jgi:hypothetical protein